MFTLIQNGSVYAPEKLGLCDVLLFGGSIAAVGPGLEAPSGFECTVIDAAGKIVAPGIVDTHVHLLGAGGGGGPASRSSAVHLSTLAKAGVTTAVGVLGVDHMGFSPSELYIRARALEIEGISTYMLCGSFAYPSVTITGGVARDICFIDKVVGVKTCMSETLKYTPDAETLKKLICDAQMGGRFAGKAGVVVSHIGNAPNSLSMVCDLMEEMLVPPHLFVATHINRKEEIMRDAIACGKRGMTLDISGNIPQAGMIPPSRALKTMLDAGVPLENITFSSDSGAFHDHGDYSEILPVDVCAKELARMVQAEGIPLETALAPLTSTPARIYKLSKKGALKTGNDADVMLLDDDLKVDTVLTKGRVLVQAKKPVVRGRLEQHILDLLQ